MFTKKMMEILDDAELIILANNRLNGEGKAIAIDINDL